MDIFDAIDITQGVIRNGETEGYQGIQAIGANRVDTKRMYCFVLRQLSPIQKGIQAAHSIAEYMLRHRHENRTDMWGYSDKTIVLLDGGDANELEDTFRKISETGVPAAEFREDSLKGLLTAFCLIADEKVWNKKAYPDYNGVVASTGYSDDYDARQYSHLVNMGLTHCDIELRNIITNAKTAF